MANPTSPRRALVIGCGGVAGGAWSIAALHQLEQQLGWPADDAAWAVADFFYKNFPQKYRDQQN